MLWILLQREGCDCGRIDVRFKRRAENDAIPGVPSPIGARTIEQHLHSQLDTVGGAIRQTTTVEPFERDECARGGDDPADSPRKPGPSVLVGIKLDLSIGNTKLQVPEPMRFASGIPDEPLNAALSAAVVVTQQSDYRKRCRPASLGIITSKRRPTPISILYVKQKVPAQIGRTPDLTKSHQ